MGKDEQAIRNLVATWMEATNAGDVARIVPLMADDVLFLTPGGPPFGRDAFVAGFTAFAQQQRINCTGELEEVVVAGDMAYARPGSLFPSLPETAAKRVTWPDLPWGCIAKPRMAAGYWPEMPTW